MDVEGSVISAAAGIVIHVLLALLFLFSTVANVLVIVIFYRRPALRTLSNRFVMSLLSFNLVATTVLLPLILMDSLIDAHLSYTHSTVDYAVCVAGQAVTTLVTTGSISAALVIAVDQYCAVMAPLHYHRRVTKTKACLLLAGQWILAVAMSAFSLPDSAGKHFWKGCANRGDQLFAFAGMSATSDDDQLNMTTPSSVTAANETSVQPWLQSYSEEVWTMLFVSSSVLCYVVPLALLTWMYLRIYSAAHRNSQRTRRTSLTHSASELVVHCLGHGSSNSLAQVSQMMPSASCQLTGCADSAPMPSRTPSLRSTSSQIVHNLRYRISNASLFLYREEARAARVSVFVLVLVVCCWMPYHVLLALHGWAGWSHRLPSYAYHLTLVAVLINALSSPFLYAYRSRRIQREVRRLFGLPPKSRKGPHRHRELSASHKRRVKSLRSLSPRRQLLRKQVRGADALSPDEVQAALSCNSRFSSTVEEPVVSLPSSSAGVDQLPGRPQLVRHLLVKMSRLWQKPSATSQLSVHATGSAGCAAAAVTSELMAVTVDISRSSFSSATSSNSTSSAESDVSL
ncbi:adenosine receptor A2a-like [Daphnia carinata]|uniref:adenosine receptor A2a-like n=1 Tax=Daphnia carinata TaxID=120202 RepID=UPI00257CF553|nr:adenosine receptor A2a-like [Daphnia carinata]